LSVTEIHALFTRLQQCQSEGRYEEADATRFELILNGVQISDHNKLWRADGKTKFGKADVVDSVSTSSPRTTNKAPPPPPSSYSEHQLSNRSPNVRSQTLLRVEQLVEQRADALVRGEMNVSKFLALELYKTYGVGVDDESRTYSFGPAFVDALDWQTPSLPPDTTATTQAGAAAAAQFPPLLFEKEIPECSRTSYRCCSQEPFASSDKRVQQRIEYLVVERTNKREERKFCEADAILRELYEAYSVTVNDETREWIVLDSRLDASSKKATK
jgi:hypothetical protein